jgi:hypothetical protein
MLLQALGPARRVIELAGADGLLAGAFRKGFPGAQWTHADAGETVEGPFDLLVLDQSLGRLTDPVAAIRGLWPQLTADARLVGAIPNAAHAQVLAQLLMGDLTYRPGGIFAPDRPRGYTLSSAFKVLLDAGWLPSLVNVASTPLSDDPATRALIAAAGFAGAPESSARRSLSAVQWIVAAKPWTDRDLPKGRARISVVVAVNRRLQHHLNVEASPGLAEIGAEIIAVTGAASAADALEQGRARAKGDWIVYCHQDVYFPAGAGAALTRQADRLDEDGKGDRLVGFAGLAKDADGPPRHAGLVIDRMSLFDQPGTAQAVSIDELAVMVRRDGPHRIDPAMGWHLWATDLILAGAAPAEIVRIPLFHNSLNDGVLPQAYQVSAAYLRAKYPDVGPIESLCGVIP